MAQKKTKVGSSIPHLWNGIPGVELDNSPNDSVVTKPITCLVKEATTGKSKKY
jgi:hypothetical protein|tara:strand:+ start:991 stop:1149 length:159 start_codon:yes stop_codon:yes gene_type:complete